MQNQEDFLRFNGKNIVFMNKDGEYYIAIRPVCDALNIVYTGQVKTLKSDPILGPALYLDTIQVPHFAENGEPVFQGRKMLLLPERYIYGWIFSIKSDKPELLQYKLDCYDLLYNHFHGIITGRKRVLFQRLEVEERIEEKRKKAKEQSPIYDEIEELQAVRKKLNRLLTQLDKKVINQTEMDL